MQKYSEEFDTVKKIVCLSFKMNALFGRILGRDRQFENRSDNCKAWDSDEDDLDDLESVSELTMGPPLLKNKKLNDEIQIWSEKLLDECDDNTHDNKDEDDEPDINKICGKHDATGLELDQKEKATGKKNNEMKEKARVILRQLLRRTHDVHVDNLIRRLNIDDKNAPKNSNTTDAEEFRFQAYVLFIKLRRWLKQLKTDKSVLRQQQRMLSLKYHGLKNKIDFIQISVIAVATMITFVDTIKQYLPLPVAATTLVPIVMSTYIGFIIAISRFYKWEDTKEKLTKMNEKLAFNINQLWKKIKFASQHKNIEPSRDWKEYFKRIHERMQDLQKDGTTEEMILLKQEIDIIMDYRETLAYKDKLSSLNLQDAVIKKKILTVNQYKENILEDKDGKINKYMVNWHFPFNLFRNACFWARSSHISGQQFFKDQLYHRESQESKV